MLVVTGECRMVAPEDEIIEGIENLCGHIVCYMAFQDIGHLIIIIINWTNATAHLKAIKDLAHLI